MSFIINNFTGPFAISNWTEIEDTGTINTTNAPLSVTLESSNDQSGIEHNTSLTITIPFDGVMNFNWDSTTLDEDLSFDPFGYLLNGNFIQLTTDSFISDSGTCTISLTSGDLFGFNARTTDGKFGPSTTDVSSFSYEYNSYPCFKEDSKILTNVGYVPIEKLKKGDLVKTLCHSYKAVHSIGYKNIHHSASEYRITNQLYRLSKKNFPGVFEDLIITGCHSILVNDFINSEQKEKTKKILGNIYSTDGKYRLPACVDKNTSVFEVPGNYTIYHLALENDNYLTNYGIFANGLLVESCSKKYLKEKSEMTLF